MEQDIEELFHRVNQLKERLELPAKAEKVKELTLLANAEGFWNNQESARNVLEEISRLKEGVEEVENVELELFLLKEKKEISEDEINEIREKVKKIELKTYLRGEFDNRSAIVTIVSGAGGDDAQDWAGMLFQMYRKYGENKKWKVELLHQQPGDLGGIKEATIEMKGYYAYGFLRKEAGVHRLVRISPFSAKKLRHTSFALVEILPELEGTVEKEMKIDPKDLRVDLYRSSGPGGQNVNRRETAVRVTHIPTGLSAASQSQRSQLQNKEKALEILWAKLSKLMREKQKDVVDALREKVSIEWGHQIRSYVFDPYKLVKDHRTGIETSNVEKVLQGEIDEFIEGEITK